MDAQQRLLEVDTEFPGFGGFWYEPDGSIHIAIGNLADSTRVKAVVATEISRREGRSPLEKVLLRGFVFHQTKFGYTDLWNWQCLVGKAAVDSVPGYQSAGVRYSLNKVRFGVADPRGIPALKRVTSSLGIPDDAILIEFEGPICTLEARSGIILSPTDSISGEILITGSHLFAREGSFIDSFTVTRQLDSRIRQIPLTHERAGVYQVGVDRDGYKSWRRTIRVDKDVCHVTPVQVTARLVRK
jgi:hypothetical protein